MQIPRLHLALPLLGLPALYWQGIEATSTSLSLGTLATFGVYK